MDYQLENNLGLTPRLNKIFDAIPDEAVLCPEDISELLQRSNETVRRWCRSGKLPSYNFGGKYTIMGNDFKKYMHMSLKRGSKFERLIQ